MEISFYKLRICDSDLVLANGLEAQGFDGIDRRKIASALLDRRRGVGADRFALLERDGDHITLRVLDPEGRRVPAIFDAALCAARFLLDSGRSGSREIMLALPDDDDEAEFAPSRISPSRASTAKTRPSGGHPKKPSGTLRIDVLDGAALGVALGPPLGLPGGEVLDEKSAAARRTFLEASGSRYEVLPLGLGRGGGALAPLAPAISGAAVFTDGGKRIVRASFGHERKGHRASRGGAYDSRAGAGRGDDSAAGLQSPIADPNELTRHATHAYDPPARPLPIPVRVVSRGELVASPPRGGSLDFCSAAAIALAAAAAAGYTDREAMVKLRGGGIFCEWTDSGYLYAAGMPTYVFRGEFHFDEE